MTLLQALLYFLREAAVGLARSWKVSLLAVLTIALSLFLGGTVQLVTSNLSRAVDDWQRQARLTIYLRADPLPGEREALEALVLGQGSSRRARRSPPPRPSPASTATSPASSVSLAASRAIRSPPPGSCRST